MSDGLSLIVVTEPTVEPITLAELKEHLRIDGVEQDAYLTALITSARQRVERYLNRALITQTLRLTLDKAGERIELPRAPLLTISNIKVYGDTNVESTVSADIYFANLDTEPGLVQLKTSSVWPYHRESASFKVNYTAGYGATAASVPAVIRHGVKMLAGKMYEHRGDEADEEQFTFSRDIRSLLAGYRVLS